MQQKIKIMTTFVLILFVFFALWAYYGIINLHTNNLEKKAIERISLYQNSLYNELTRFNFLPFVIARDKQLIDWSFQQNEQANIALENIKKASGANVVYVMDAFGKTLSSSNWHSKTSFINKNFAFRPYFKEAIQGNNGQFFGIGTTSKKPGLYISTGVKSQEKIIAVTVAKVDLSILETIWTNAGENIFVTNADGVVILSSKKHWKYRPLHSLGKQQLSNIKTQQQFSNQTLKPLFDNKNSQGQKLSIDNLSYLHQQKVIKNTHWNIHYLTPSKQITKLIVATWIKIGLILLIILAIILLLWLFKSRGRLKISLQESANLKELNGLLKVEIKHRQQIENKLIIAQKNIQRTSKLAAMGQLSASIIHELGQPLSAMKTYIASAQLPPRKNQTTDSQQRNVLPKLDDLVERMSKISQQLKFFSHPAKKEIANMDIKDALKGALMIISPALKQDNIELTADFKEQPYLIKANQISIEQVLINLIDNARAAVHNSPIKKIIVQIKKHKNTIIINIIDSGTGIDKHTLKMLFEPFYTTKPSGVGLGLGLTISTNIIHEFNGKITAINNDASLAFAKNVFGSTFTITLPVAL